MPSNHLILCLPFLFLPSIFPSIGVFSDELVLLTKWPKYGSFSFSISPSKEYSGLNPFRIDSFDLLAVQGTLKRVLSSNTARKHLSLLYGSTLTYVHDCQKNHSFDYTDFCWQSDVSAFEYTVWVCHSFPSKEQASFNFLLPHLIFLGVLETLWKHFEFLSKSLFPCSMFVSMIRTSDFNPMRAEMLCVLFLIVSLDFRAWLILRKYLLSGQQNFNL